MNPLPSTMDAMLRIIEEAATRLLHAADAFMHEGCRLEGASIDDEVLTGRLEVLERDYLRHWWYWARMKHEYDAFQNCERTGYAGDAVIEIEAERANGVLETWLQWMKLRDNG
jgi:hypothetical protein